MAPADSHPPVASARTRAVAVVFAVAGFTSSTWWARLPELAHRAHLTAQGVGLVLGLLSGGTLAALIVAGPLIHRIGAANVVRGGSALAMAGLIAAGSAVSWPLLALTLLAVGVGASVCDVAMNVEASKRGMVGWRGGSSSHGGRPADHFYSFHGAFSLGTVVGAATGAVLAWRGIPVSLHLPAAGALAGVAPAIATRWFVDRGPAKVKTALARHPEKHTRPAIAIGLLLLGLAFAEGTAFDWLTLAFAEGYRARHYLAAAGLGLFLLAMTVTRFLGRRLYAGMHPVRVLVGCVALVVLGSTCVVLGGRAADAGVTAVAVVLAAIGTVTWGIGAAPGVPLALRAAGAQGSPALRMGIALTISYGGSLVGPLLLGLIARHWGFLIVLWAAPAVMVLGVAASRGVQSLGLTLDAVPHPALPGQQRHGIPAYRQTAPVSETPVNGHHRSEQLTYTWAYVPLDDHPPPPGRVDAQESAAQGHPGEEGGLPFTGR